MKTSKQKELILEQLKKTPIIQVATEKVGVARSSFYRWKSTDPKFAEAVDEAIDNGVTLMNEYAESMLITAIKNQNLTAVFYWLNHRHPAYETRMRIDGRIKHQTDELTPEQTMLVERALKNAGLLLAESELDNEL